MGIHGGMTAFFRLITVAFYLIRLSRSQRGRMLFARARAVAHSPEGRELLGYAQRAARDPKNRKRLQLLVAKTRKAR
jgi:hypothetical protein